MYYKVQFRLAAYLRRGAGAARGTRARGRARGRVARAPRSAAPSPRRAASRGTRSRGASLQRDMDEEHGSGEGNTR